MSARRQVVVVDDGLFGQGEMIDVDLSRPRDQLATKEHTDFLAYRHRVYQLLHSSDGYYTRPDTAKPPPKLDPKRPNRAHR